MPCLQLIGVTSRKVDVSCPSLVLPLGTFPLAVFAGRWKAETREAHARPGGGCKALPHRGSTGARMSSHCRPCEDGHGCGIYDPSTTPCTTPTPIAKPTFEFGQKCLFTQSKLREIKQ